MTESLQKPPARELSPKEQYSNYVDRLTTQVIAALPISVRDEDLKRARARFRVAFSADAQGSLLECTGESIARAIVLSAMSGLMPGGPKPDIWLIPRKNKWKNNAKEANWQISYRGFIRLARRAGWDLEPVLVFEGEDFQVTEGTEPSLRHIRNLDVEQSWDTLRYAYVRIFPVGGGRVKVLYLNKAQIAQRRAKAQDQDIWNEWPLEQSLKTICNYAGNREAFPLDDPARYAMEASEQAEIGGGSPLALGAAKPAALPEAKEGPTIDLAGAQGYEPTAGASSHTQEPGRPPAASAAPNPPKSRDALVDEIREATRTLTRDAKVDAWKRHWLAEDWLAVTKLKPDQLAAGLEAFAREQAGLAAMARTAADPFGDGELERERQPGEDNE